MKQIKILTAQHSTAQHSTAQHRLDDSIKTSSCQALFESRWQKCH